MLERDRAVRGHQAQIGAGSVGRGAVERGLRDLDAHGIRAGVAQRRNEAPGAAAEVQDALAGARLAEQQRAAPLPGPRLGIGRRLSPEVLVVRAHAAAG